MIETQRLQGEIHAVVIVEGRHADRQLPGGLARRRRRNRKFPDRWCRRRHGHGLPLWPECSDQLLQPGRIDAPLQDEFRQPVEDAVELREAAVGQGQRRNVAGKPAQRREAVAGQIARIEIAFHQSHAGHGRGRPSDLERAPRHIMREQGQAGLAVPIRRGGGALQADHRIPGGGKRLRVAAAGQDIDQLLRPGLRGKQRPRKARGGAARVGENHQLVGEELETLGHQPAGERGLAGAGLARDEHGLRPPSHRGGMQRNRAVEIFDQGMDDLVQQGIQQLGQVQAVEPLAAAFEAIAIRAGRFDRDRTVRPPAPGCRLGRRTSALWWREDVPGSAARSPGHAAKGRFSSPCRIRSCSPIASERDGGARTQARAGLSGLRAGTSDPPSHT